MSEMDRWRALEIEEAGELADMWRRRGLRIIATAGCFDLLHVGHLRYLQAAARLGDRLIVGVSADEVVREIKGPSRPIVPEAERAELVGALRCVSAAAILRERRPVRFVETIRPAVYVKGGDYQGRPLAEQAAVEACGGVVWFAPYVPGRSTTELARRIRSG